MATARPLARPPSLDESSGCGEHVAITDGRPTIDTETGRVTMLGRVIVAGAAIEDLRLCMAETCALVEGGRRLADGEEASFSVTAKGRPGAFTVKCTVVR